jgi:hypothetical protein
MKKIFSKISILGVLIAALAIPASAMAYSSSTFSFKTPTGWKAHNFKAPDEILGFTDPGIGNLSVQRLVAPALNTTLAKSFFSEEHKKQPSNAIAYAGQGRVDGNAAWYGNVTLSTGVPERQEIFSRDGKIYIVLVAARTHASAATYANGVINSWRWL